MTHICVGKLTIIGSDNGLTPERRQAIIWTNDGILLIESLGTNFSEILIEIQTFSLKKIRLKISSVKCCSFRLGLNVLIQCILPTNPSEIYNVIFELIQYQLPMNPSGISRHHDVIKWNDLPHHRLFVRGIHRSPVNFPHNWSVTGSFDVFFDLCRNE